VRWFLLFILLVLVPATQGPGCDVQVELTNAPPVATWLQASGAADGIVDLTVWVYDLEQQPVDLEMTWSLDGVDQGELALASGGHGLLGLTTITDTLGPDGRPDPDGQPHLIRWTLPNSVAGDARLQVHVLADDRESTMGPRTSTSSDGFTADDGLPTVSLLSAL
jgi:hypothetical protein